MNVFKTLIAIICFFIFTQITVAQNNDWKIKPAPIMTEWGSQITPENAWTEYPRPQMVRKDNWTNLNGLWDYQITKTKDGEKAPSNWKGKILVPFAAESALSGVKEWVRQHQYLWYKRNLKVDKKKDKTYLLHFEAVDYQTAVFVNGKEAGQHTGGNTPFRFDISDLLITGDNEISVRVYDMSDNRGENYQLIGKQTSRPTAIRYTQVTGIWQTVWLEEVPKKYISRLKILTQHDPATISVKAFTNENTPSQIRVRASFDGKEVSSQIGPSKGLTLKIADAKLWSPKEPNLYDLKIDLLDAKGLVLDSVDSYTGIRTVGKKADAKGHLRFTLNDKVIFHWGPLDQGWWPDGLLTPPSDQAMQEDLKFIKDYGFNMVRVHIKVNPRRFYYHCDKMGLLVWQDQVSGGPGTWWSKMRTHRRAPDKVWPPERQKQFIYELKEMVDHLHNSPAIVSWVPFNESWGQHNTLETGEWIIKYDPSRLINIASGGNFWPIGDIADAHAYPDPGFPLHDQNFSSFIKVIGEFGGYGFNPSLENMWNPKGKHHGYGGKMTNAKEFEERVWKGINILEKLKHGGVAGAVYTQITDVENENNGLMTYDRKVKKISKEAFGKMSSMLLKPLPETNIILSRAIDSESIWQYTFQDPGTDWSNSNFNSSSWKTGKAGFGKGAVGVLNNTEWPSNKIWMRREFHLNNISIKKLCLSMKADDHAFVFINGTQVASTTTKGATYQLIHIKNVLKEGKNVIAVHATNKRHAQFIDLGLVDAPDSGN